jgi:hypothetical protein
MGLLSRLVGRISHLGRPSHAQPGAPQMQAPIQPGMPPMPAPPAPAAPQLSPMDEAASIAQADVSEDGPTLGR